MIVVSKRFIAKGEEVSNNYGVHYTQVYHTKDSRVSTFNPCRNLDIVPLSLSHMNHTECIR